MWLKYEGKGKKITLIILHSKNMHNCRKIPSKPLPTGKDNPRRFGGGGGGPSLGHGSKFKMVAEELLNIKNALPGF